MGFKFGNNVVKLEIEGKIFRTRISQKMLEDMKAFAEKAKKMQLGIIGCTDTDAENKIIDFLDGAIDTLIAPGTAAIIFNERERDAFERCEVFAYISTEITAHCGVIASAKGI